MGDTYEIHRFYENEHNAPTTIIRRGLTLEEAQAHCSDPETSSSTATSEKAREHTDRYGAWFDAFTRE